MVTPPDCEAQILRYHHVEKWPIGTIAQQLHVHHSVVRRVHGDSVLGHGYAHAVSGSWQPILRCVCRVQLWAIGSLRSELETAPTAATAGRGERTTLFRLDVVSLAKTGRTWI